MKPYTNLSDVVVDGTVESSEQGILIGAMDQLPAASADYVGYVIKYMGNTAGKFVKYQTYVCKNLGGSYSWEVAAVETSIEGLATKAELEEGLASKADNSNVIHTDESEEDILGIKNFNGGLTIPDLTPREEGSQMAMPAKQITTKFTETDNEIQSVQESLSNKLGKTENAASATKATQDGQGRNIASTYALKSDITSVYKVMGSCTTAQLASKAKNKGDVWNLTDAGSYGGAGTNVVYTGTEWDALGGTIDLSGYATKSAVQTAQSKADNAYSLAEGKLGKTEKASSATSADKATNDSNDRNIVNTYATKAENNTKLNKSGDKLTGYLANKQDSQLRNITISTNGPSGGIDGDIWFKYKA